MSSERVTEPFGEGVCLLSGEFFGVEDIIRLVCHLAIDAEPSRELFFGDRLVHVLLQRQPKIGFSKFSHRRTNFGAG